MAATETLSARSEDGIDIEESGQVSQVTVSSVHGTVKIYHYLNVRRAKIINRLFN